ncbi:MAG: cytochrome P450 [Acidimicrobiales bacterium]
MSDSIGDEAAKGPERMGESLIGSDRFGQFDWADPWPTYDRLRQEAPYWRNPEGVTVLTRYADCEAVLRDSRFSSSNDHADPPMILAEGDPRAFMDGEAAPLIFLDPPDHTRIRKLVNKAFTPRSVERLRPRVQEVVDGILDRAADEGGLDVVADLGYELPVIVICELLGVPLDDRPQFAGWSSAASRLLDDDLGEAELNAGVVAAISFAQYFAELFELRRKDPRDDLVSGLLAAEEQGDRLSIAELHSIVILLFIAGHETTMNLIGNGTHALLRQPDQLVRWRDDPSLDAPAVEELLRFDGPVHLTGRIPVEDVEIHGHVFPRGKQAVTLLAAANRDPARFDHPDRLDLLRPDNHQLTFSQGIHYCLGAALARLEGQAAIGSLIRRFPDLELAEPPVYRDHFVLRGLTELRVTV